MNLNKQFFTGGNATFTVQNPIGEHYTFKIRQPKDANQLFTGPIPFFVSLLSGPDNESDYIYLGLFEPITGTVRLTKKSKFNNDSKPVKVVRWALKQVWDGKTLPLGYQIRHEGKCGCCGRTLTVPESLDRGIGPECWEKLIGG